MEVILLFEIVEKLCGAFGVSGNEEGIRETIKSEIGGMVDLIYTDVLGNLIAVKKGTGKKVMLAAHMDEIGLMVTHIDENGFLRFSNLGGISPFYATAQRVKFNNGILGTVFYEQKLKDMKSLKLSKMYIDAGFNSREEAEKKTRIGDTAKFFSPAVKQGDRIISGSLDDRSGCAVLVQTIKEMPETNNELYFVFTVQEELGLRGAGTAAYSIRPDIAIALDVTSTGDTPESEIMEVKCGKGPAVKIKDNSVICHPEVRSLLEESARILEIPYQLEVLERGGSDPGAIHIAAGGIPSGAISIPCRYVHSPVESVSIPDLENCVKLLRKSLELY
jgi:putative aminopeptidase FrvX